jgi:hypothetical protein
MERFSSQRRPHMVESNVVGKVVAITEAIATAGAISWWRLSGTIDEYNLQQAWKAAGLDEKLLPHSPSASRILRRVLREHENKTTLVRSVAQEVYALARRADENDKLRFVEFLRARATESEVDGVDLQIESEDTKLAAEIRSSFECGRGKLDASDVSGWLCDLVKELKAVSLRDMGGIYFIPFSAVATWQKIIGVLRALSGHFFAEVPALRSDEAVDAILDAVIREAKAEADELERDLEDPEKLGTRAFKTRATRCEEMSEKVKTYEALLEVNMEPLRERLRSLQANIAAAILAGGSDE